MGAEVTIPEKDEFKIGEVCEIAGVKPFVLRYWETEFPQLAPAKGSGGQRTYTRADVELILQIKRLLYEERFTVAGAKKRLVEEVEQPTRQVSPAPGPKKVAREVAKLDSAARDKVKTVRRVLGDVRRELAVIIETLK